MGYNKSQEQTLQNKDKRWIYLNITSEENFLQMPWETLLKGELYRRDKYTVLLQLNAIEGALSSWEFKQSFLKKIKSRDGNI